MRIRESVDAEFDLVSLGECMVRLSPPAHGRLEFADSLEVHVGGGEYNVAYALARLGLRAGWVGALVDNPLGRLVMNHARAAGVDLSSAVVVPYDGLGRSARMGLNFTEVGSGLRPSVTVYDRAGSATAKLRPQDVDWDDLFGRRGVRWFHTGGIFTALSTSTREVVVAALKRAKQAGTFVSYDLNFRSKLWDSPTAIEASRPLIEYVDCLIGNEEDFQRSLGYEVDDVEADLRDLPIESYAQLARRVVEDFPGLSLVGTTLREVVSASVNSWSAVLYERATDRAHVGPRFEDMAIEDRVGGGDGFASGMAWALLSGFDVQRAVASGTAHGALLQTTRGDTSQVTRSELEHIESGGSARIIR
jgi:2-dehydro-3-deoxygluconokinase